jgi:hypothetical protein
VASFGAVRPTLSGAVCCCRRPAQAPIPARGRPPFPGVIASFGVDPCAGRRRACPRRLETGVGSAKRSSIAGPGTDKASLRMCVASATSPTIDGARLRRPRLCELSQTDRRRGCVINLPANFLITRSRPAITVPHARRRKRRAGSFAHGVTLMLRAFAPSRSCSKGVRRHGGVIGIPRIQGCSLVQNCRGVEIKAASRCCMGETFP